MQQKGINKTLLCAAIGRLDTNSNFSGTWGWKLFWMASNLFKLMLTKKVFEYGGVVSCQCNWSPMCRGWCWDGWGQPSWELANVEPESPRSLSSQSSESNLVNLYFCICVIVFASQRVMPLVVMSIVWKHSSLTFQGGKETFQCPDFWVKFDLKVFF